MKKKTTTTKFLKINSFLSKMFSQIKMQAATNWSRHFIKIKHLIFFKRQILMQFSKNTKIHFSKLFEIHL